MCQDVCSTKMYSKSELLKKSFITIRFSVFSVIMKSLTHCGGVCMTLETCVRFYNMEI